MKNARKYYFQIKLAINLN